MTVSSPNILVGTTTGTGAAINLETGFDVAYAEVWNITDGDTKHEFFAGMTDGHALKTANHDTAQQSRITSNGFTPYAGSDGSAAVGITLGTDISEDGKTLGYKLIGK